MTKTLEFTFLQERCRIQFLKVRDWLWIFDRPDGSQNTIPEPEVARILGITTRTAAHWRTGHHPNPASLYAIYTHATGRIIPLDLVQKGVFVKGETLHYRNKAVRAADIPDLDYLQWLLRQQSQALKKTAEKMTLGRVIPACPTGPAQSPPHHPAAGNRFYLQGE